MAKKVQTGAAKKAADQNAADRAAKGKGPNPNSKLANPAGDAAKEPGSEIVTVNKKALSVDVGPKIAAMLDRSQQDEQKAFDVLEQVKTTRYNAINTAVLGILKAAENDKNINLADVFSGDKKKMNHLNNQLGLCLGFREVAKIVDGDKTYERVVTAKAMADYFPGPNDKKDKEGNWNTPEAARKDTLRSNFITLIKRAAGAAEGIRVKNLKASVDKKTNTMLLEGPALREQFGSDKVLLNENTKQDGVTLKAKPSFTAIRDLGAVEHDAAPVGGKTNTRGPAKGAAPAQTKPVDPDIALQTLAAQVIQAMGKFDGPLAGKTKERIEQLQNAIAEKLKQTA